MKFKIVYDKPQRVRLRCGAYAFEKEQEGALYNIISASPWVNRVEVNSANGGILVSLKSGGRNAVLSLVKSINPQDLKPNEPCGEHDVRKIDRDFHSGLVKLAAKRYILKALLPKPLMIAYTVYQAFGYIKRALKTLFDGKLTVDVLDGASVAACLIQRRFGTAGTVMFLLNVSGLLEDYTKARTKAVLNDSLAIKTDKVWLVTDCGDVQININDLRVGDKIRVQTGKVIPVDGVVAEGEAMINEASMTGEPLPVAKREGISVYAGTVIEEGSLVITVRSLADNTKISKIIELIGSSEQLKAGVQSRAETLADRIVPFSFIGFFAALILTRSVNRAMSLLMVDYSCAIKLSTPIAVISAIKEAADRDVTIKGGKYLEAFAKADTIVFDKTGTLTNAEPVLEKVVPFDGYSEERILTLAACLEEHFPHSVANAVVNGAAARGISHVEEHTEVEYVVAHGIASTLYGERVVIGSKHFVVEDENVAVTPERQKIIDEASGANSVLYLAIGGKLAGALCISDPPRAEAKETIDMLRREGIKNVVMLTGDSHRAAKATAKMLGITDCKYQVLPEDKHKYVEQMKQNGQKVIMVGDGINDTPALAAADVSVAMHDASDIARETADITIKGCDLRELVYVRRLSTAVMERINKNFRFIVAFNTALIALGFAGVIQPSVSAFLHNGSTMLICAKSMTPLTKDKNKNKDGKEQTKREESV